MSIILTKTLRHDGYWIRVLVALDELGAAILGMPNDVTISSWCGRWREYTGWRKLLGVLGYDALDAIQWKHCESAIIHDEERAEDANEFLEAH